MSLEIQLLWGVFEEAVVLGIILLIAYLVSRWEIRKGNSVNREMNKLARETRSIKNNSGTRERTTLPVLVLATFCFLLESLDHSRTPQWRESIVKW